MEDSVDIEDNSTIFASTQSAADEPSDHVLLDILTKSSFNWFEFAERLDSDGYSSTSDSINELFFQLPNKGLSKQSLDLVVQSHRAFMAVSNDMTVEDRTARSINGEVVTESETESESESIPATDKLTISSSSCSQLALVIKKLASVKRRARRLKAKVLAERRLLSRKMSKRTSKIVNDFPNIGEVIEEYVKDELMLGDELEF